MNNYTEEQLKFINYDGDKSIILSSTAGSGKEQPLFSKVLTPNGWTTMGSLKVGSEILTPKGVVTKVTNIYPQGLKDYYELTFSDGSKTHAGIEHLWRVKRRSQVRRKSNRFSLVTTLSLINELKQNKAVYIPMVDIEYNQASQPIDPCTFGRILNGIIFSKNLSLKSTLINSLSDEYNLFERTLIEYRLMFMGMSRVTKNNVYIPNEYIRTSKKDRISLLKGLFHNNPDISRYNILKYVHKEKNIPLKQRSIIVEINSEMLSKTLTSLVNSLGGVVIRQDNSSVYHNIKLPSHIFELIATPLGEDYNIDDIPSPNRVLTSREPHRKLVSVELMGKTECQCIEIEHEDHLYVTDDYIVTHNTHSAVGRLNKLIEDGVDPKRIIFFSFTNDAVDELKSRVKHDVKITTIHSFTSSLLGKMKLYKPVATFQDFITWHAAKIKPTMQTNAETKAEFYKFVDFMYENANALSASISSYKLQIAEKIPAKKPKLFLEEYKRFLTQTRSRDFSDMLIEVEKLTRKAEYKKFFDGLYDYVFVDEYQDTSAIQMRILLAINAKQYHLIGDKNQSIYGFSGANCTRVEEALKERHEVEQMNLTVNFRSKQRIVNHANNYTDLKAVSNSEELGMVHPILLDETEVLEFLRDDKPLVLLVRTNSTIKNLEFNFLKQKIKMRYFNYLTPKEVENIAKNNISYPLKKKLDPLKKYFPTNGELVNFITENMDSDKFITTIHKSKGREYSRCVVVNSLDPEVFDDEMKSILEDMLHEYTFYDEFGEPDEEAKNVHYVAVTRAVDELYFLLVQ
jgi:hypothetical protein